jgi:hypothetical protein
VVIVKIRNLRARCLEPNSDIPYVLHIVEYEVESELRDNLWLERTHTMYATDPIDAINKARESIDEPSVVKHAY